MLYESFHPLVGFYPTVAGVSGYSGRPPPPLVEVNGRDNFNSNGALAFRAGRCKWLRTKGSKPSMQGKATQRKTSMATQKKTTTRTTERMRTGSRTRRRKTMNTRSRTRMKKNMRTGSEGKRKNERA